MTDEKIQFKNIEELSDSELNAMGLSREVLKEMEVKTQEALDNSGDAKEEEKEKSVEGNGLPLELECSRCGWDKRTPFSTDITEEDKKEFLMSIASEIGRFTKTYSIYGGVIKVTFRDLTTTEFDKSEAFLMGKYKEFVKSVLEGVELNDLDEKRAYASSLLIQERNREFTKLATDYNTAMAIASIEIDGVSKYKAPAQISEPDECYKIVWGNVITRQELRASVRVTWLDFRNKLDTLNARAHDANFFQIPPKPGQSSE